MPSLSSLVAALTLSTGLLTCTAAAENAAARVPVLLELFTSEGCSSCPPADHLLEVLDETQPIDGADLIVLSEHVDYWDNLGWKDPFSSRQFTLRQQQYTNKYNFNGVYTPQLVVDGRGGFVGSDGPAASSAIKKAIRERKVPVTISNVTRHGSEVTARIELTAADTKLKAGKAVLCVAVADNRAESHVARGENAGRSIAHVGVTRVLKEVAAIDPAAAFATEIALTVPADAGANGLKLVAFLQDPRSGYIVGVASREIADRQP